MDIKVNRGTLPHDLGLVLYLIREQTTKLTYKSKFKQNCSGKKNENKILKKKSI